MKAKATEKIVYVLIALFVGVLSFEISKRYLLEVEDSTKPQTNSVIKDIELRQQNSPRQESSSQQQGSLRQQSIPQQAVSPPPKPLVAHQTRHVRKAAKTRAPKAVLVPVALDDSKLELELSESTDQALDVCGPIDEIICDAFDEMPLTIEAPFDRLMVAIHTEYDPLANIPVAVEVAPIIVQDKFTHIKERLLAIAERLPDIPKALAKDQPLPPERQPTQVNEDSKLSAGQIDQHAMPDGLESANVVALSAPGVHPESGGPELCGPADQSIACKVATHARHSRLYASNDGFSKGRSYPTPRGTDGQSTKGTLSDAIYRQSRGMDNQVTNDQIIDRILSCKWFGDNLFEQWLVDNHGHVQFYLRPHVAEVDSNQDIIFPELDFDALSRAFEFHLKGLVGTYRLYAGIYKKNATDAIAQIPYREFITSAARNVIFKITKRDLDRYMTHEASEPFARPLLYVSVFEGATGNYREPKRISKGIASLVGLSETSTESVAAIDSNGNAKFRVTPRSEVILKVEADGFWPTYQVVPIGNGAITYSRAYLVSNDQIETVSTYFRKEKQDRERAVLLGTIFDTSSRRPKAHGMVRLNRAKNIEKALYFGALPDPTLRETTGLGKFGFYNVEGFRWLLRPHERTHVFRARKASASYLELGRSGKSTLIGSIVGEGSEEGLPVRLFSDKESQDEVDEQGNFEISGIDFPLGVLDIEVAESVTYTIPWGPAQSKKKHVFYYVDPSTIQDNFSALTSLGQEKNTGRFVGGITPPAFFTEKGCYSVELNDSLGGKVSSIHGPYAFSNEDIDGIDPQQAFCLKQSQRGFAFYNLAADEYLLKVFSPSNKLARTHVVHVFANRTAVRVVQ